MGHISMREFIELSGNEGEGRSSLGFSLAIE